MTPRPPCLELAFPPWFQELLELPELFEPPVPQEALSDGLFLPDALFLPLLLPPLLQDEPLPEEDQELGLFAAEFDVAADGLPDQVFGFGAPTTTGLGGAFGATTAALAAA